MRREVVVLGRLGVLRVSTNKKDVASVGLGRRSGVLAAGTGAVLPLLVCPPRDLYTSLLRHLGTTRVEGPASEGTRPPRLGRSRQDESVPRASKIRL